METSLSRRMAGLGQLPKISAADFQNLSKKEKRFKRTKEERYNAFLFRQEFPKIKAIKQQTRAERRRNMLKELPKFIPEDIEKPKLIEKFYQYKEEGKLKKALNIAKILKEKRKIQSIQNLISNVQVQQKFRKRKDDPLDPDYFNQYSITRPLKRKVLNDWMRMKRVLYEGQGIILSSDQLYETIKQKARYEKASLNYDVTLRIITESGQNRFITIASYYLQNKQNFVSYLEEFRMGVQYDNDYFSSPFDINSHFDYDFFIINFIEQYGNGGSFESQFYNFYPQDSNKPCFKECILQLGINCEENDLFFKDFEFQKANEYCKQYGIRLQGDSPILIKMLQETEIVKKQIFWQVQLIDETPTIIFENGHYQLIQSQKKCFLDNKTNLVNENKKILFKSKEVAEYWQYMEKLDLKQEETNETKEYQKEMIHFDIETVYDSDKKGLLKPILVQFYVFQKLYIYYGDDCIKKFISKIIELQTNQYKFILNGYNSSRFDNFLILSEIIENDLFNKVFMKGSSILQLCFSGRHEVFDTCRFALSKLSDASNDFCLKFRKQNLAEEIRFQYQSYHNFFHEEGCYFDKDIECLINLNDVEITKQIIKDSTGNCKCKNFSNFIIYGAFDVLALKELYEKIQIIVQGFLDEFGCKSEFYEKKTIGSTIMKIWKQDITSFDQIMQNGSKRSILPLLTLEQFKSIKGGLTAGRSQSYRGKFYDLSKKQQYIMLDVVSLYPYVMLNRYYPCGNIIEASYEYCKFNQLIGFFNVTFSQENCIINVLPKREQGKPLDWNYKGILTQFISTQDLDVLRKHSANIIKIEQEGLVFTQIIHGSKLFRCLQKFKEIKIQQDKLKTKEENIIKSNLTKIPLSKQTNHIEAIQNLVEQGIYQTDEFYNPSLRNITKIFQNSLSGKVGENLHLKQTLFVENKNKYDQLYLKHGDKMKSVVQLESDKGFVQIQYEDKQKFTINHSPCYLSAMIYSYSRSYMMDEVLSFGQNEEIYGNNSQKIVPIYQDTDSILLELEDYQKLIQYKPWLIGKEYGDFDYEKNTFLNGQAQINSIICLCPKNYFLFKNEIILKKGFKGINLSSDRIMSDVELLTMGFVIKKIEQNGKLRIISKKLYDIEQDKIIEIVQEKESKKEKKELKFSLDLCNQLKSKNDVDYFKFMEHLWNTSEDKILLKEGSKNNENLDQFLKEQLLDKTSFILCSSLEKLVVDRNYCATDNKKEKTQQKGMQIYQRYIIKCISSKSNEDFQILQNNF